MNKEKYLINSVKLKRKGYSVSIFSIDDEKRKRIDINNDNI